jgi:D-alanine-D-alanine ligase-like ATP-grasp enzyme
MQNYKKLEIQNILNKNQINTPHQISYSDLQEDKHFPLFCKENKHGGIVFQIYKKSALNNFFDKFDKNDFYLEQSILDKDSIPKEFKVYYVNGNVYSQDEVFNLINDKIKEVCIKIAESLNNLETFSVDIMQTSKEYYVVDVNPASGFFLSSGARKAFLNSI